MLSSEIAHFLKKELLGRDIEITGYSSILNMVINTVVFVKKITKENLALIGNTADNLVILPEGIQVQINCPHFYSPNPRLDFIKVINAFFHTSDIKPIIDYSAVIEEGAIIGENVSIGANCYIGSEVCIGDYTTILPNVCIYGKTKIGNHCHIKPGVVIGGPGFGYEFDENDTPLQFPHNGRVEIGNNVHIGANTTIDRATVDATIVEDNVKIDNLVHLAHNCKIGRNTLITSGVIIAGGTVIGEKCWIAPNATIHQKLIIGNHATIGMGAIVLRNVKDGITVFGNPAKRIEL